MRRQTILLAAALVVATPSTAFTESRPAAPAGAPALQHRESAAAPDRLTLRIEDAAAAAPSDAPVAEAALLFELAEAHKLRALAPPGAAQHLDTRTGARAPSAGDAPAAPAAAAGADAPARAGFTAHRGVAPDAFAEDQARVRLNLAPVSVPDRRTGAWETLRLDDKVDGADVSGVAVGLSFKLN